MSENTSTQQYLNELDLSSEEGMNVIWEMFVSEDPSLPPHTIWSEHEVVQTISNLKPHTDPYGTIKGDAIDFLNQRVQGPYKTLQKRLKDLAIHGDLPPEGGEPIVDYVRRLGIAALSVMGPESEDHS